MAHLKRAHTPTLWPITRKGTTFVVRPRFSFEKGVPLLIFLRDMAGIVQNRKELKKAIHNKHVLVNHRPVRDERMGVMLFDVVTLVPSKTHLRLTLGENKKFALEEISEKESKEKITKVANRRLLKGKKTQLNLYDGQNILSEEKCKTHDSVLLDLEKRKVQKVLSLRKGASVIAIAGKHTGAKGKIDSLDEVHKMAAVDKGKEKVNVLIEQLMVVN